MAQTCPYRISIPQSCHHFYVDQVYSIVVRVMKLITLATWPLLGSLILRDKTVWQFKQCDNRRRQLKADWEPRLIFILLKLFATVNNTSNQRKVVIIHIHSKNLIWQADRQTYITFLNNKAGEWIYRIRSINTILQPE